MSDSLVTAVLERTSDGGRRGRLLAWPRSLAERHPTAARWLRTAWVVWSWLSLALYLVSLVLVPSLREGARPWLWCYWILIVWFLLARTKTLRWRLLALTFSAACVLAPLIGLVEVALARATGMDVNARDGAVLLAGPVEEALKLLPLVGILLLARRRARRLAVVDCLLVGLAAGLGFQAVEDAVRRLALTVNPQGLAGLLATLLHDPNDPAGGYAQYYFGLLPGWSNSQNHAYFGGHHVLTALVAAGIGLALRGRRRFGAKLWLLPAALFGMVVVDHAMYNADGSATGFGGPHDLRVPDWLLWLWRLWGHGLLERPLLVGLLVVALAADVQRLRHVWPLLPPVPELRWASVPAERMRRAVAPPSAHGPAGQPGRRTSRAIALTLRSGADLLSFVLHELALLFLAATGGEQLAGAQAPEGGARAGGQQPAGGPVPAGGHALGGAQAVEAGERQGGGEWPAAGQVPAGGQVLEGGQGPEGAEEPLGRRWPRTIVYLRERRELGQALGRAVERAERAPEQPPGMAWAAASVLVALVASAALATAGVTLVAAVAGGVHLDGAFLADLFDDLADWWNGLPLWQQALVTVAGAALLTLGGLEFLPALGAVGFATSFAAHGHGAADFVRDPRQATRRFLAQLTPGHALSYLAELTLARLLPGGVGGGAGRLARRQLDHALRLAETRELLARRAEGLARSTRLLGKLPRNARYAGFTRQLPGDLANTYPAGVRFNSAGFPDFRPYATRRVELDGLTGGRGDFARANAASGLRQTPRGMTWHHVEDGRTLLLVPTRLHQAVGHTGGAKIVQVLSGLSDAERSEWIAWLQGETPP